MPKTTYYLKAIFPNKQTRDAGARHLKAMIGAAWTAREHWPSSTPVTGEIGPREWARFRRNHRLAWEFLKAELTDLTAFGEKAPELKLPGAFERRFLDIGSCPSVLCYGTDQLWYDASVRTDADWGPLTRWLEKKGALQAIYGTEDDGDDMESLRFNEDEFRVANLHYVLRRMLEESRPAEGGWSLVRTKLMEEAEAAAIVVLACSDM